MSQLDTESKEIAGFTYTVSKLDPLIASDLFADLGHILAPVIGALGGQFAREKSSLTEEEVERGALEDLEDLKAREEKENEALGVAIEKAVLGFFDRYNKAKQREVITIMAAVTTVEIVEANGDMRTPFLKNVFKSHFKGRIGAMYHWLFWSLGVQYKDFFTGMGFDTEKFRQLLERALSKSQTTSEKTQESGAL